LTRQWCCGSCSIGSSDFPREMCTWPGVTCSVDNKLIAVELPDVVGQIPPSLWEVRDLASIVITGQLVGNFPREALDLPALRTLVLSSTGTAIVGTLPDLSRTTRLVELDLSGNRLTIPLGLKAFPTTLKKLDFSSNKMYAQATVPFLKPLTGLELLDLSDNLIEGSIPVSDISAFGSLTYLDLSSNRFSGGLSDFTRWSSRLTYVNISNNQVVHNNTDWSSFSRLKTLDLSYNLIGGTAKYPSSLQVLDLAGNSYVGSVPTTIWTALGLQSLDLSLNAFSGSLTSLTSLTQLTYLNLNRNKFATIPTTLTRLTLLQVLDLSYNGFTNFNLKLDNFTRMTFLSLSSNKMSLPSSQTFPPTLEYLSLSQLRGIPLTLRTFSTYTKLQHLDVSQSKLSGFLPASFLEDTLRYLDFSANTIAGSIPAHFLNRTNMLYLDLSSNRLSGTLATSLAALINITYLDLSFNSLSGCIPTEVHSLPQLLTLDLHQNFFTCALEPDPAVPAPTKLLKLDLSFNQLDGSLPLFLTSHLNLRDVSLSFNKYNGSIPPNLFERMSGLKALSLEGNRLETEDLPRLPFRASLVPQDVDECALNISQCPNGSICSDGWTPVLSYTCTCGSGYRISPNDTTTCIDIDECYEKLDFRCNSHDQCINTIGSYECCPDGYAVGLAGVCEDIDECYLKRDNCSDRRQCLNTLGSFLCCNQGYEANTLEGNCTDIDECAEGRDNCTKGTCVNTDGSFFCCNAGFTSTGGVCVDIDECYLKLDNCVERRQCINTYGSFMCCNPGFYALEGNCTDIDECDEGRDNCTKGACINTIGAWSCCSAGFLADSGVCKDIDECYLKLDDCTERRQCINTVGSFHCCPQGFMAREQECIDVNECAESTDNCTDSRQCINTNGSYYCCNPGFARNEAGDNCTDVDECYLKRDNCTEANVCVNTEGSFYCCSPGYKSVDNECVDINECTDTRYRHNCSETRKCVNTDGSFYCCGDGFRANDLITQGAVEPCVDINECVELKDNCTAHRLCINTIGDFYCCPIGYEPNEARNACQDQNECQDGTSACPQKCINVVGGYDCCDADTTPIQNKCQPCFGPWQKLGLANTTNIQKFKSLLTTVKNPPVAYDFEYCRGPCTEGLSFEERTQNGVCFGDTIRSAPCAYACTNISIFSAIGAVESVFIEFQRGDFLKVIMKNLFNVNVSLTIGPKRKRATSSDFTIGFSPCPNSSTEVISIIEGLARDIAPNIPNMNVTLNPGCNFLLSAAEPTSLNAGLPIGIIVGVVLGLIILIIIIILLARWYFRDDPLAVLPAEVSWPYRLFTDSSGRGWEYRGTQKTGYHFKELSKTSTEFRRAKDLFSVFGRENPEKQWFQLQKIFVVYNPLLVNNFVGSFLIQTQRKKSSPQLFATSAWTVCKETQTLTQREWVMHKYQTFVDRFSWNSILDCPIIPVCHGTEFAIAERICETGFASLSSLDAGYYGKGIYFSSYSVYLFPYIAPKRSPAIIVSWVIPGNVYPVTEDRRSGHSLLGAALKSGYNSHFVVTNRMGEAVTSGNDSVWDEIVISQESQIAPAFIFEVGIDAASLDALSQLWKRELPAQTPIRHSNYMLSKSDSFISLEGDSLLSTDDHF